MTLAGIPATFGIGWLPDRGGWIVGDGGGYEVAFWISGAAAAITAFGLVPLVAASPRRSRAGSDAALTARAR